MSNPQPAKTSLYQGAVCLSCLTHGAHMVTIQSDDEAILTLCLDALLAGLEAKGYPSVGCDLGRVEPAKAIMPGTPRWDAAMARAMSELREDEVPF